MKIKIIWILIVLLLILIFFSRTSYYDSSSSSSSSSPLTFSSSDWRSQVMKGRYILPNAPKEWIANYVDFGPNYLDLYTSLSDDKFSNMMTLISTNDFYRKYLDTLAYAIITKDGKDEFFKFFESGSKDNRYEGYFIKYVIPYYRSSVLKSQGDPRNAPLLALNDQELYLFMRHVPGYPRNTENTTGDMRKASDNLIVHGKLKEFINDKIIKNIQSEDVLTDKYLIDNMKSYTPYCKNSWWQFWRHDCSKK